MQRYAVKARRKNSQEAWSEWAEADNYDRATYHARRAEEAGYEVKLEVIEVEIKRDVPCERGTLGYNIRRLMKKNGYTQKELAMRAGCAESAISKYTNNKRNPSIRLMKNLAIALGVTLDELTRGE